MRRSLIVFFRTLKTKYYFCMERKPESATSAPRKKRERHFLVRFVDGDASVGLCFVVRSESHGNPIQCRRNAATNKIITRRGVARLINRPARISVNNTAARPPTSYRIDSAGDASPFNEKRHRHNYETASRERQPPEFALCARPLA